MAANFPYSFSRRSFLAGSAASVFSLSSSINTQAHQLSFDDEPNLDESFIAVDDMFEVQWDSDQWSEYELDGLSSDGVIRLRNRDKKDRWDPGYTVSVSYQRIAWGSQTLQEAIDRRFNLGMLGSVIFDTWDDDNEMGFIFNSGKWEANTRTLMVSLFRPIVGQPERRLSSDMVLDQSIFDSDHVKSLLDGFSIDGGPFSLRYENDDLISFLEANLD